MISFEFVLKKYVSNKILSIRQILSGYSLLRRPLRYSLLRRFWWFFPKKESDIWSTSDQVGSGFRNQRARSKNSVLKTEFFVYLEHTLCFENWVLSDFYLIFIWFLSEFYLIFIWFFWVAHKLVFWDLWNWFFCIS